MSKITKKGNHIFVPDHVTIPYIEGDGVGHEITPVSQKIVNAAIKQAYNGTRSIEGTADDSNWWRYPFIKCGPPSDVGFICLSPSGSLVQRSRISGKGAAESEYVYLP